jgi:EAL domain-containing protein (putative c-di-GMP-specific phosphodiesterase class I)
MLEALRQVAAPGALGEDSVERVLRFARAHLAMQLAWISRTVGDHQVIEFLDGGSDLGGLSLGAVAPGHLAAAPLGLPDGRRYGLLACLGGGSHEGVQARDIEFLELVAALLAPSIAAQDAARDRRSGIGARVQAVLDLGGPTMVYQPVWTLGTMHAVGFEALARFPCSGPPSNPDRWFAEATEVGLGLELEVAAIRGGLAALASLPADVCVAVNVSAATLQHPAVVAVIAEHDPRRTIVEITEHDQVGDYRPVRQACEQLRSLGCVIAVDDAGAGYAGFQHLIEIRPDVIKLDQQITHDLDSDPARAAMASALVGFARAIDATVLAEGVETRAELAVATDLGIDYAQGYYLGRPLPLPRGLALVGG